MDVQYERSDAQLDKWGEKHGVPDVIVATGFIAKNPQGQVWHVICEVTGTELLQLEPAAANLASLRPTVNVVSSMD